MTMKLLLGVAAISKAITSIQTRGKKLDNSIQQTALSVIHHIEEHGDVTLATNLVAAMPKGSRSNALKAYMETFSKATWVNGSKDKPAQFIYTKSKETDMDGAYAIMWTEFKPEPVYQPIDIVESVAALLNRIEKDAAKRGTKYDPEKLELLRKVTAPAEPAH